MAPMITNGTLRIMPQVTSLLLLNQPFCGNRHNMHLIPANRRQFSEQMMLQSLIVQLKSLDEDDKQKLLDLTEECFNKRKNRT